ncbi:MAG: iduronate 2-sulfatase [Porticoccaceae bacterium]|jgi:iduronate 2-sulfatase
MVTERWHADRASLTRLVLKIGLHHYFHKRPQATWGYRANTPLSMTDEFAFMRITYSVTMSGRIGPEHSHHRGILRSRAVLLFAFSMLTLLSQAACQAAPNVLFIVADDLNCAVRPYGDSVAVTPNLDRLAGRGLVFERAYCQQAVCNPSRSSFLTGLRPDTVGVDDLRKSFRETAPGGSTLVTLPEHFKNHGYFCQNIGKLFHNMGETQDRRSWSIDEVLFKGTHADDTVFANTAWQGGKRPYKAEVTEAHDVPDTAYRDGQIANLAAAMLRDHAGSKQPFFLAVGFWRPHLPFVAPKKYWDLYQPEKIPLPDPAEPPTDVPSIAMHESREIKGYGLTPKDRDFTEDEIRHFRHGYYASISFMDAQVGEILDALDESGQADDTIIVFTSDHGFHIGEHSLWGKTSNFELDARVPLIIASPNDEGGHGKSTESLAELVDLYPTLTGLAGIDDDLPGNLEGVSLAPIVVEPTASVKDAAFTQHQQPFYGSRQNWKAWGYSVRTARWRFTEWRTISDGSVIARELYDHEHDGRETKNLAASPSHRAIVTQLAERLSQQFPVESKN